MRITYVTRSFLDYRIPVLAELDRITGGNLSFITSNKWTPERALARLKTVLGERAIYLSGERSLGTDIPIEANTTVCVTYQPGLWRAIDSTRPEVLVGDGLFKWTTATLLRRLCKRTPVVVCYERWARTERNAQWYRRAYRVLALKLVSAVCCNGQLSEEYVRSLGVPGTRITQGHMAADTEALTVQKQNVSPNTIRKLRESLGIRGVVFLYVGRLIQIKGLDRLLDAWARFEAQYVATATLLIVGGGPEDQNLRARAKAVDLHGVRFVGPVDYSRLVPYYACADAFIIPALEDNWSLVVPEAMACGLPILCSKYNGCWPELVQEGRNGWVFDPLQPLDILRALEHCVRNATRLPAMGEESKKLLLEHTPQRAARSIFAACELAYTRQPGGVKPLAQHDGT